MGGLGVMPGLHRCASLMHVCRSHMPNSDACICPPYAPGCILRTCTWCEIGATVRICPGRSVVHANRMLLRAACYSI